jgi:hemin uptake protein HemP
MPETHADAKRPGSPGGAPHEPPAATPVPVLRAAHLLGAAGIVHIEHHGQIYTLRRTRNGRLLLTK